MKPFNLKEYLANPNKKMVTRDGREVERILCTDAKGPYPIVALVENNIGSTAVDDAYQYTVDGRYLNRETDKDLFFDTQKHEGWVNIFKSTNNNYYVGNPRVFESKEDAEKDAKKWSGYTSVKIEWEE